MAVIVVIAGLDFLETVPVIVLGAVVTVIYYAIQEGLFDRTLGKWVTGTRVVNEQGRKPRFIQIVGRSFARLIPFEPFSVLQDSARGWHDSLARTYVVKYRGAPANSRGEDRGLADRGSLADYYSDSGGADTGGSDGGGAD